jgi:Ribosomal protein L7/L12 C-terminal domain
MGRVGAPELIILLAVVILLILRFRTSPGRTVSGRLDRLEWKVDRILDHLGIDPSSPTAIDGIAELLAEGRKIEAIRLYRERTGVGLKEAKDAVDRIQQGGAKPAGADEV